jgi:hypothetical protein
LRQLLSHFFQQCGPSRHGVAQTCIDRRKRCGVFLFVGDR